MRHESNNYSKGCSTIQAAIGVVIMLIVLLGIFSIVCLNTGKTSAYREINEKLLSCQNKQAYPCKLPSGATIISLSKGWVQFEK